MPVASQDMLTGLGVPAQLAALLGANPLTQAGVGTAQVGATTIKSKSVELTTAGGATAFIINPEIGINEPVFVVVSSATTALIFPPAGQTMNGSTTVALSVPQWKGTWIWQYKKGFWTANVSQ